MKEVLLSIIIPIYNGEKYIKKMLDFLLSVNIDKEIIAIDDCSTDQSWTLLKEYEGKIKIIQNSKNSGVSKTRNVGLNAAQGKYVSFIDIDDDVDEKMFLQLVRELEEKSADVAVCNFYEFYPNNSKIVYSKYNYNFDGDVIKNYLIDKISPSPCDKIYRRSVLTSLSFNENLAIGEDILFCLNVFLTTQNVVFVNEYYYHYLQHDHSAVHKVSKKLLQYRDVISSISLDNKKLLEEKYLEYFQFFQLEMTTRSIHAISSLISKENKKEITIYLKELNDKSVLKQIIHNPYFSKSTKIEIWVLKNFGIRTHLFLVPIYKKLRNIIRK